MHTDTSKITTTTAATPLRWFQFKVRRQYFRDLSLDMAVAEFEAWRDENGFGAREIGSRYEITRSNASGSRSEHIGYVHYNGRVELTVKAAA